MSLTSSSPVKAGWWLEQFRAQVYDRLEKHTGVVEKPFAHDPDSARQEVEGVMRPAEWQNPVTSPDPLLQARQREV